MNRKKLTNIVSIALISYLAIGFFFALYAWSSDLKMFTRSAPDELHNTIGIGGMWNNPDSERCSRRGFEFRSIKTIPYFTVAWPAVIVMQMRNTEPDNTDSDPIAWQTYTNEKFGYSFEYPAVDGQQPYEIENTPTNRPAYSYTVFKTSPSGPGLFGVQVYPTGFASTDEWIEARKSLGNGYGEHVIEQNRTISGEDAIVTYWRETPENDPPYASREHHAAFMHQGALYVINARGMAKEDKERIWDSFRFPELTSSKEIDDSNAHDGTIGTLRGTLFLGEPCPARGDALDIVCTGEPAHETFNLVRNFISNETWQQFGTNESGQFEFRLPTGEYAIEYQDTRLGRQQRLVNVFPDEETEVTITFEEVHTYTNPALGFSMLYPSSVYLIHEDDELVQFSTLTPDDLRQQSGIGLISSLNIRTSDTPLIEGGEEVEIRGERVFVADTVGAYAGEVNREYFYPEHNLSVSYVAIPPQDTFFTRMILSISFE